MFIRRIIKSANNNIKNFSLMKKQKVNSLGRWNTEDNPFIKVDLANHDSCGGPLCGDPPQPENNLENKSEIKSENDKNLKIDKFYNYSEDELKYYIA